MKLTDTIRTWLRERRRERAKLVRQELKQRIQIEDAQEFFAGFKSKEESRRYRDTAYAEIDKMTDDEVLGRRIRDPK